ncbi:MAG: biotin--[acetyl-CoA-carboxylase] ligase [Candidatus Omnitrophica bacterium]|nr:biotin--[acetyl-CoA-carboxylase] ligase [Candidatus Omnitrophota bacterium]
MNKALHSCLGVARETAVLAVLKQTATPTSLDKISKATGLPKASIFSTIEHLKELGYGIVSFHSGIRLEETPDRLYPCEIAAGLDTKLIGRAIHYFESVSSTMDYAFQYANRGAPEGTLVVAEAQTKGRGRLGRTWYSPSYCGLYFSVILRPKLKLEKLGIITLLSGVSVCEAIKKAVDISVALKWPNDILIDFKKVGGILTEVHLPVQHMPVVVVGIGLNVNTPKSCLPSQAVSLRLFAKHNLKHLNRTLILQEILRCLEKNYFLLGSKKENLILEKWRTMNITLGEQVRIKTHFDILEAQAVDIDEDGGLLVRTAEGRLCKFVIGEIEMLR